jgi:tetratricopeptide (TPR) repeat protein
LGRGEFDAAIEDYNSALAIMPNSASAYCNRGIAYRSNGELARAIADYTSAIRYNTSFAEAYNNRGEIYLRQEKYDQAMADFNQALHIDPAEFDAYDNRGDLNLLLGKPEAAIKDYTRVIDRALQTAAKGTDLHPGARLAEIYRKRASAHLKADQPHKAVVDAGEALEINPDDARAYAIRRDAYRKLGQTKLAEADDNRASRLQHTGSAR